MKIAIFTPSFLPKCSGAEIFHHNLATRLAAAGHEPVLVVPRRNAAQLAGAGLPYAVEPFPAQVWSWMKRAPRLGLLPADLALGALQRRHRFDVWHGVVTYPTGVCLAHWQRRSGVPCLVRAVGDDLVSAPEHGVGLRRHPVADRLVRAWLPRMPAVVSLSETMSAEYRALGVPAERIHYIPNAVDLQRFAATPDRAAVRAVHRLAPDTFLFLSVGRNHPQKDFPTLLRAAAILRRTSARPFQLLITGRDSGGLAGPVRELGLGEIVRLGEAVMPGAAERFELPSSLLVALYRSADAFVMSSLIEGFSSALLEAMAAGLPVVVTDAPGCHEFVRAGRDALVAPRHDPEALAAGMRRLLEEAKTREDYATRSLARAAEFDWPRVVGAYVSLYEQIT